MEQMCLFRLEEKIAHAVSYLKMFEAAALAMSPEGYYLAFSGGKDSQVIYQLAVMARVKFTAHYHITTVDPPELFYFIRKEYPDVYMDKPETTMWDLIVKKGFPPTRMVRYCCSDLKERGGEGKFVLTGVRWEESRKRKNRKLVEIDGHGDLFLNSDNDKKRRLIENCQIKGKRFLNPIIDWTDEEVWVFIHRYVHRYCELYDLGFSRIGCIGCPLVSRRKREKEFARYPKFKEAYIRAFARMLQERPPKPIQETSWKNAEEVYQWWLYGTVKKEQQVSGQLSLNLPQEAGSVKDGKIKENEKQRWMNVYDRQLERWNRVCQYGDPTKMWADGVTLNHIRLELMQTQAELKKYDILVSIPKIQPDGYMARADQIRNQANDSLKVYTQNPDYQYLCEVEGCLNESQQRKTQIAVALGKIRNLERAIKQDDLVVMREFGSEERLEQLLSETAVRVKGCMLSGRSRSCQKSKAQKIQRKAEQEPEADGQIEGQMSIFDLAS